MLTLTKPVFAVTESDVRLALTDLYGLGEGFALLSPAHKFRIVAEPAWFTALLVADHCDTCKGLISHDGGCPCGEWLGV